MSHNQQEIKVDRRECQLLATLDYARSWWNMDAAMLQ
jgi:hypothetical protein